VELATIYAVMKQFVRRVIFSDVLLLPTLQQAFLRDRIDVGRWQQEIFKTCQRIMHFTSHFLLWSMFCVSVSNYSKTVQIVSKLPTVIQAVTATADKTGTSPNQEYFKTDFFKWRKSPDFHFLTTHSEVFWQQEEKESKNILDFFLHFLTAESSKISHYLQTTCHKESLWLDRFQGTA